MRCCYCNAVQTWHAPKPQGANWGGQVDNFNWRPRAFRFRNFLSPAECDFLIAKVRTRSQLRQNGLAIQHRRP